MTTTLTPPRPFGSWHKIGGRSVPALAPSQSCCSNHMSTCPYPPASQKSPAGNQAWVEGGRPLLAPRLLPRSVAGHLLLPWLPDDCLHVLEPKEAETGSGTGTILLLAVKCFKSIYAT